MTPLDHALAYAARGWRVIPIPPGCKHPKGYGRWQDVGTTDTATITAWWTANPDHGIGILTGPESGIFVLDVDVADGKAGDDTLHDLEAAHGDLPATATVRTGSGGLHLYFAWPDGADIRNSASGTLGPGLDVRGAGGFVVAPPSVHPNGRPYEWIDEEETPHAAPAWLIDLLTATPEPPSFYQPTPGAHHTFTAPDAGDRPGDRWADTVTWHDLLVADGWTHHHTDRNGEDHWTRPGKERRDGTSATTGHLGSDVLKVFTSSIPTLPAESTWTKVGYVNAVRFGGDWQATGRWCKEQVDGPAETWGTGTRINTTAPSAADVTPDDPPTFIDDPSRIDWDELRNMDPDADDWLIAPFVARGRGHALYAPAKAGKSLFTLYAVACAAAGHDILDHPAGAPVRTLYLDLEMANFDVRERLDDMGLLHGTDLEPLAYYSLPALPTLDTAEGGQRVLELAQAHRAELVVIDTMSRVIGGEEDSADTLRAFFRFTGSLLKAAGIATVRIDHAGKDLERGMRGTSAKADDVDVVWQLLPRDAGRFDLRATHRRMGWVPEQIHLDQTTDPLGYAVADDSWPAGTREAADLLVELGVPLTAGRPSAARALRDGGHKVRNGTLQAALRWRRTRPTALTTLDTKDTEISENLSPGQFSDGAVPDPAGTPSEGADGNVPHPAEMQRGQVSGTARDTYPGELSPVTPPLGGGQDNAPGDRSDPPDILDLLDF